MTATDHTQNTGHIPENAQGSYFATLYNDQPMVDFLESNGMSALSECRDVYNKIHEDARKTLTFLLAGVGISFGYFFKLLYEAGAFNRAALCIAIACAWLSICAALLLKNCINSNRLPVLHTAPKDFYTQAAQDMQIDLRALRLYNLDNIAQRIERHGHINRNVVRWLDRVRNLTAATPLVALLPYIPPLEFISF